MKLAIQIGEIAEEEGYHPEFTIRNRRCTRIPSHRCARSLDRLVNPVQLASLHLPGDAVDEERRPR